MTHTEIYRIVPGNLDNSEFENKCPTPKHAHVARHRPQEDHGYHEAQEYDHNDRIYQAEPVNALQERIGQLNDQGK